MFSRSLRSFAHVKKIYIMEFVVKFNMALITTSKNKFTDEIIKLGGTDLLKCYQCGTCTAVCPLSEVNINFRKLLKYAQLGIKDKMYNALAQTYNDITPWLCLSCRACYVQCPRGIEISKFMRKLRHYLIQKDFKV